MGGGVSGMETAGSDMAIGPARWAQPLTSQCAGLLRRTGQGLGPALLGLVHLAWAAAAAAAAPVGPQLLLLEHCRQRAAVGHDEGPPPGLCSGLGWLLLGGHAP